MVTPRTVALTMSPLVSLGARTGNEWDTQREHGHMTRCLDHNTLSQPCICTIRLFQARHCEHLYARFSLDSCHVHGFAALTNVWALFASTTLTHASEGPKTLQSKLAIQQAHLHGPPWPNTPQEAHFIASSKNQDLELGNPQ